MVMYRGLGQPSFSDVEAQLFRHLIKHIVQLWYFGLKEELSSRSGNDISRSALARLDGQLLYAGPEIFNFLKSQWKDWDGLTLPEPLLKHFNQLPQSVKLAHGCVSLHLHGEYVLVTDLDESHSTLKLSPREQRVAYLFASGFTYKQISKQLALSPATVRTYLRNAYIRLGVSNKTQLNKFLASGHEVSK
jgi:DNA-binding CsgD family transcriptional regulator